MILPNKNITLHNSLLNCAALLLSEINDSNTVFSLRERTKHLDLLRSYKKFILSLDILYILGIITLRDGFLVRCNDA